MIDLINTFFIFTAAVLAVGNVLKLYHDKHSSGLTLASQLFFLGWTFWSLYYYHTLNQPLSLIGEGLLSIAMIVYVLQMIYYRGK